MQLRLVAVIVKVKKTTDNSSCLYHIFYNYNIIGILYVYVRVHVYATHLVYSFRNFPHFR